MGRGSRWRAAAALARPLQEARTLSARTWAIRTRETLDDPAADGATVVSSLRDIARINRAFGNAGVAVRALRPHWRSRANGRAVRLLDVGTGLGDIPRALARAAARDGVALELTGVERHAAAARAAGGADFAALLADGAALPFRDGAFDIVLCAKLLHHLPGARGVALVRELARVTRGALLVLDLRRSALAAAGIWLASWPMRFHPVTRRDAVVSVFRGFRADELAAVFASAGLEATIRSHPGYCLTATWCAPGTARA